MATANIGEEGNACTPLEPRAHIGHGATGKKEIRSLAMERQLREAKTRQARQWRFNPLQPLSWVV